ncbi:putative major facilitator, sugar transporter, MFS transporter superfamily [Helianthus anomalus]
MDYFLKEIFPEVYIRKQEHLNETDYYKYDSQILTLFTSSLYFAALISTFSASHVTRIRGRRASILWGAVSFFVGSVINNAGAQNIAMLIIGRCFLGFGIGFGNQAIPLYLSEMAPAKIRGTINQLFQLTTCSEDGRRVLEKVGGTKNIEAELVEASEAAKAIKHPFKNLLKRKNRPQLIIGALGIPMFQQLTGNNSIMFYAPVIFQSLGFGSDASLWLSTLTSGILVVATFVSIVGPDGSNNCINKHEHEILGGQTRDSFYSIKQRYELTKKGTNKTIT